MMRTWCGLEIIFCPFVFKHKTLNLNQGYRHQANIVSRGYSQQLQNYLNLLVSFIGRRRHILGLKSVINSKKMSVLALDCSTDYRAAREIIWYFLFSLGWRHHASHCTATINIPYPYYGFDTAGHLWFVFIVLGWSAGRRVGSRHIVRTAS